MAGGLGKTDRLLVGELCFRVQTGTDSSQTSRQVKLYMSQALSMPKYQLRIIRKARRIIIASATHLEESTKSITHCELCVYGRSVRSGEDISSIVTFTAGTPSPRITSDEATSELETHVLPLPDH